MQTFVSQHTETDVIDRLHKLFGRTNESTLAAVYDTIIHKTDKQNLVATSVTELVETFRKLNQEQQIIKHSLPGTFAVAESKTINWLYQPDNYIWNNLQHYVVLPEVQSATLFAPLAWQLGSLFYNHCRSAGVVTSIFDDTGFSSVELLLKNYPVDLLITTNNGLRQCIESNTTLPPRILVIVPWGETPWLLVPDNVDVLYEIHLYPGFPLAEARQPAGTESFHFLPTTEYLFAVEDGTVFASSLTPTPVPLLHYQLPKKVLLLPDPTSHHQLQYG